jgi:hypothetical protein
LLNRMVGTPARLALCGVLLAAAVAPAAAQQPPAEQPQQQREHVVRRGDTLWDLARTYLSNPFLWPMIFEANRDVVRDPHWIYPAERLIIPPLLQQRFQQPEPIGVPPLPPVEPPPAELPVDTPTTLTTLDMRRPVLTAGEYLRLPWLSPTADPGITGRIQQRRDATATSERIAPALYPNEEVFITQTAGLAARGDSLVIVRAGRRVGTHGTIMEPLAVLRVDSVHAGGVLSARIVNQFGDARVGDVVMPVQLLPETGYGQAVPVAGGPEGHILEFLVPEPMHGTTDLAFISLGRASGVGIGDEFAVYLPAAGGLPASQVGVLRVVRVGDRTATARVVSITGTALRDGLPIRLVRRMP